MKYLPLTCKTKKGIKKTYLQIFCNFRYVFFMPLCVVLCRIICVNKEFCRMDKCHNPRRNCGTLLWFCNLRFVPFVHPPFFVYHFLLFRIYLSIFLIFSVHYRTEDKVFSHFPVPSVPLKRRNSNPSSCNHRNDRLPFHALFFNDCSFLLCFLLQNSHLTVTFTFFASPFLA